MATECGLTEEIEPLLAQIERSLEWLRRNRSDMVVDLIDELQKVTDELRVSLREL